MGVEGTEGEGAGAGVGRDGVLTPGTGMEGAGTGPVEVGGIKGVPVASATFLASSTTLVMGVSHSGETDAGGAGRSKGSPAYASLVPEGRNTNITSEPSAHS